MENKIDISKLMSEVTKEVGEIKWVDPRNVTGLPTKIEILEMESQDKRNESITDDLVDYIEKWFEYTFRSSISDGELRSPIEKYVDSMLYIFLEYHNSTAGIFVLDPNILSVEDARNCLPVFKKYLLNCELTDFERNTIQMYLTDFYQFDDLWEPSAGRFHKEFSDRENALISLLANQ